MRPALGHFSVVEDDNLVAIADGAQAMRIIDANIRRRGCTSIIIAPARFFTVFSLPP
jgi:uncharacterized protein (DUF169 family)